MQTRTFRGAGVDITAITAGDETRPPVVLVHGGGQTKRAWTEATSRIAEAGWHAVAVDLRGHGDSGRSPDGRYTIDHFAADLRSVASQLGRPPVFIGSSLGGNSSLIAVTEPSAVKAAGLVLVDVAPQVQRSGLDRLVNLMLGYPDGFASLEEAAAAVDEHKVRRRSDRDPTGLGKVLRQREDGRWVWSWDPGIMAAEARATYSDQPRMEAAAQSLTMPTMLIRGAASDVVTPEAVQQFASLVPHASLREIVGVGHTAAGEKNTAFLDAILEFLASIESDVPVDASRDAVSATTEDR